MENSGNDSGEFERTQTSPETDNQEINESPESGNLHTDVSEIISDTNSILNLIAGLEPGSIQNQVIQTFNFQNPRGLESRATNVVRAPQSGVDSILAFTRQGYLRIFTAAEFEEEAEGIRFVDRKILQNIPESFNLIEGLEYLYKRASASKAKLDSLMDETAIACKIDQPEKNVKKVVLKSRQRVSAKMQEYQGHTNELVDLVRGTIVFDDEATIRQAINHLRLNPAVKRLTLKDRFKKPSITNYRDVLINLELMDGDVVEVQLHLKELYEAKQNGLSLPPGLQERLAFNQRDEELTEELAKRIGKIGQISLPKGNFFVGQDLYELSRAIQNDESLEMSDLREKLDKARMALHNYAWTLYQARTAKNKN